MSLLSYIVSLFIVCSDKSIRLALSLLNLTIRFRFVTSPYNRYAFASDLSILTSPRRVSPYNLATHSHESIHTVHPYNQYAFASYPISCTHSHQSIHTFHPYYWYDTLLIRIHLFILTSPSRASPYNLGTHFHESIHTVNPYNRYTFTFVHSHESI